MKKKPFVYQALKGKSLLAILASVYTIQSLIGMFALQGLPTVMRSEGISTIYIGLFYAAMIPWAIKFLWAPIIDRQRKKGNDISQHGVLILSAQIAIVFILIMLALTSAISHFYLLFIGLMMLAFASTCADITVDGLAVDELPANKRHLGNMMQVGGSYIGALFGGGLFIYLSSKISWQYSIFTLTIIVLFMAIPSLMLFSKKTQKESTETSSIPSLKNSLGNPKVRAGLILVILSQLGTRSVLSMMQPFLVDQEMSLESLGILAAGGGLIGGIVGVFIGGLLVKILGDFKSLLTFLIIEVLLFIVYFLYGTEIFTVNLGLQILVVLNGIITAAKFVSLYSMMMGLAHGDQSAVDFTLFQSTDMIVAIIMAIISGFIIAKLGYSTHYALAIFSTIFAIFILKTVEMKFNNLKNS